MTFIETTDAKQKAPANDGQEKRCNEGEGAYGFGHGQSSEQPKKSDTEKDCGRSEADATEMLEFVVQ